GSEKSKIYFSAGYLLDEGYAIASDVERLNTRLNGDLTITDNIDIGGSLGYSNTQQSFPTRTGTAFVNSFQWARNIVPIYPVYVYDTNTGQLLYKEDGSVRYDFGTLADGMGSRPYGSTLNLVATTDLNIRERVNDNIDAKVFGKIRFLNDFEFTYNFAGEIYNNFSSNFQDPLYGDAAGVNGRATKNQWRGLTVTHQQLLTWDKDLDDLGTSLDFLLGHESQEFELR